MGRRRISLEASGKRPSYQGAGRARLPIFLGGWPGNATLKDDVVFWVKALPSRAHGRRHHPALLNWTGLRSICPRPSFVEATRWAAARRLSGPACHRFDGLSSLARP